MKRYRGSIRATAAGGYQVRWREGRNRKSRTFPPGTTRKAAEKWLTDKVQSVARVKNGTLTFSDLAELYVRHAHPAKAENSRITDESYLRVHLRPFFGDRTISEITTSDVDELKARSLERGLSKSSVNRLLTLLSAMFSFAIDRGHLDPLQRPKLQKYKLAQREFSYLRTDEEVLVFLEAAKRDRRLASGGRDAGSSILHPLYATAIYSGLRIGEIAGLRRIDVDLDAGVVHVRRSYGGPTKGKKFRTVPIMEDLRPTIGAHLAGVDSSRQSLVFTTGAGTMLRKDSRHWNAMLDRTLRGARQLLSERRCCRVEDVEELSPGYITAHDLRHTFASHFAMKGGDMFRLQQYLGHEDLETTMMYAHLSPHVVREDADRLSFSVPVEPQEQPALATVIRLADRR